MEQVEVWPKVVMDIGIGRHVHDLDVDLDAVTEHLRENGMSDDAIANLEIRFVDEQSRRTKDLDGKFIKPKNKIEIYTDRNFKAHDELSRFLGEANTVRDYSEENARLSSQALQSGFNETLYHELEHAIIKAQGNSGEVRHITKYAGIMMLKGCGIAGVAAGSLEALERTTSLEATPAVAYTVLGLAVLGVLKQQSLAARKMYKTSPEEARCRLAEKDSGLVTVRFKPVVS